MHSTENVDDGYLGSGRRIKAEIKKYGKENFVREILEHLPTREALCEREAELVCEELMQNPLCLNLKNGGDGGGKFWSEEQHFNASRAGALSANRDHKSIAQKVKNTKRLNNSAVFFGGKHDTFLNKHHSSETKAKIGAKNSKTQSGQGNSQYGTCWVTNGIESFKIKKEQLGEYLIRGFHRGRKSISKPTA